MRLFRYVIAWMSIMCLSSTVVSVDTRETISISFCGWSESEEECTRISKKKITSQGMATESTIWSYLLCRTVWCIGWVSTVHGKSTLLTANQKGTTMLETPTRDTNISNCTISRRRSPRKGGLSGFIRGMKGPIEKLLSWSKRETIRGICRKKDCRKKWLRSTAMPRRSEIDPKETSKHLLDKVYGSVEVGLFISL